MAKYTRLHEAKNNQPLDVLTRGGKEFSTPEGMPGKVIVNGQHFEIIYFSNIYTLGKVRLRGIVMYNHRTIVIDPTQTLQMMKETLYHEMAHVYLAMWQAHSKSLQKLTDAQVEEICDMFADAHIDASLNNPSPA